MEVSHHSCRTCYGLSDTEVGERIIAFLRCPLAKETAIDDLWQVEEILEAKVECTERWLVRLRQCTTGPQRAVGINCLQPVIFEDTHGMIMFEWISESSPETASEAVS
jgi:hypothetical protein